MRPKPTSSVTPEFNVKISLAQGLDHTATRREATTTSRYDLTSRPHYLAKQIRDFCINDGVELCPSNRSRKKHRSRTRSAKHHDIINQSVKRRRKQIGDSNTLTPQEQLDGIYTIHSYEDKEGKLRATHSLGNCRLFGKLSKAHKKDVQRRAERTRRSTPASAPDEEETYQSAHGRVHMIQEGRTSK